MQLSDVEISAIRERHINDTILPAILRTKGRCINHVLLEANKTLPVNKLELNNENCNLENILGGPAFLLALIDFEKAYGKQRIVFQNQVGIRQLAFALGGLISICRLSRQVPVPIDSGTVKIFSEERNKAYANKTEEICTRIFNRLLPKLPPDFLKDMETLLQQGRGAASIWTSISEIIANNIEFSKSGEAAHLKEDAYQNFVLGAISASFDAMRSKTLGARSIGRFCHLCSIFDADRFFGKINQNFFREVPEELTNLIKDYQEQDILDETALQKLADAFCAAKGLPITKVEFNTNINSAGSYDPNDNNESYKGKTTINPDRATQTSGRLRVLLHELSHHEIKQLPLEYFDRPTDDPLQAKVLRLLKRARSIYMHPKEYPHDLILNQIEERYCNWFEQAFLVVCNSVPERNILPLSKTPARLSY